MERGEFIKCCMAGVCACAAGVVPTAAHADDAELKSQMDFVHYRFAKLVQILKDNVAPDTRNKVFESLGRACAGQAAASAEKFRGDVRGYLAGLKWAEKFDYDEKTGALRVVANWPKCVCAFVDQAQTPGEFCECTLGWQKEMYSIVYGKPVHAELEESILRGGKRCIFKIRPA